MLSFDVEEAATTVRAPFRLWRDSTGAERLLIVGAMAGGESSDYRTLSVTELGVPGDAPSCGKKRRKLVERARPTSGMAITNLLIAQPRMRED